MEISELDLRAMVSVGHAYSNMCMVQKLRHTCKDEQELLEFIEHTNSNSDSAVTSPCPDTCEILDSLVVNGKLVRMDSVRPDYPNASYSYISKKYA